MQSKDDAQTIMIIDSVNYDDTEVFDDEVQATTTAHYVQEQEKQSLTKANEYLLDDDAINSQVQENLNDIHNAYIRARESLYYDTSTSNTSAHSMSFRYPLKRYVQKGSKSIKEMSRIIEDSQTVSSITVSDHGEETYSNDDIFDVTFHDGETLATRPRKFIQSKIDKYTTMTHPLATISTDQHRTCSKKKLIQTKIDKYTIREQQSLKTHSLSSVKPKATNVKLLRTQSVDSIIELSENIMHQTKDENCVCSDISSAVIDDSEREVANYTKTTDEHEQMNNCLTKFVNDVGNHSSIEFGYINNLLKFLNNDKSNKEINENKNIRKIQDLFVDDILEKCNETNMMLENNDQHLNPYPLRNDQLPQAIFEQSENSLMSVHDNEIYNTIVDEPYFPVQNVKQKKRVRFTEPLLAQSQDVVNQFDDYEYLENEINMEILAVSSSLSQPNINSGNDNFEEQPLAVLVDETNWKNDFFNEIQVTISQRQHLDDFIRITHMESDIIPSTQISDIDQIKFNELTNDVKQQYHWKDNFLNEIQENSNNDHQPPQKLNKTTIQLTKTDESNGFRFKNHIS
ncbi:unnamed protein product [Didymodactylos carnosus]|uniref:Uncharacterized protein n=1 Tax=Didymodactylos carnosus TaxID=1234261 RepID=A0A814RJW9_9BILA|nr:unnamed protein product [Didymodactylos carnosus]CAF3898628.1 unnamed protein product [Didymodactylos carnosus]